jgi:hypothetical protein
MAFPLGRRDPESVEIVLGQAVESKRQQGESPVTFGYSGAVPTQRFAGARLSENIGEMGEFAQMTADPKGRQYVKQWAQRHQAGPFTPFEQEDNTNPQEVA